MIQGCKQLHSVVKQHRKENSVFVYLKSVQCSFNVRSFNYEISSIHL